MIHCEHNTNNLQPPHPMRFDYVIYIQPVSHFMSHPPTHRLSLEAWPPASATRTRQLPVSVCRSRPHTSTRSPAWYQCGWFYTCHGDTEELVEPGNGTVRETINIWGDQQIMTGSKMKVNIIASLSTYFGYPKNSHFPWFSDQYDKLIFSSKFEKI